MEFYRNADLLDTSYGESGETYITYSHEVHASDMDAEFRCDVFNTHGRRSDTISFQAVYGKIFFTCCHFYKIKCLPLLYLRDQLMLFMLVLVLI